MLRSRATNDLEARSASAPSPVAVITGGSAGLGAAICRVFLAAGYRVVILGRSEERLQSVAASMAGESAAGAARLTTIVADVTSEESVEAAFKRIAAEKGGIDVLVNCVGGSDRGRIEALTRERLSELFELNVTSALLCSQAALPMLKQSRGVVVNIGSLAGKFGARYLGGYCAAKHALAGLTQQMRLEWAEYGVHVALVNPGPIRREDAGERYRDRSDDLPESASRPGGGAKLRGLPPERVAAKVLDAARRRRCDLILPPHVRLLVVLTHACPPLGDYLLRKFTS